MTTKGFRLCNSCKERLAAMKRDLSQQCWANSTFGGRCQKRTSHASGLCQHHRRV